MQDRDNRTGTRESWALRPWAGAAIGALAGLVIWRLLDGLDATSGYAALRTSTAAFAAASAVLLAFTFERIRASWSALFAIGAALVVALIIYWNGPADSWTGLENWRAVCVVLAVAIAAPLFQTARDEGRASFPYQQVHAHAWTNVVIWFASWVFVGVVFLLAWLLSALFDLIGIDLLKTLLNKEWFVVPLMGAALGGAVGLLRERDRIVGLLQRVVVSVLAVLAPVLGIGLLLFLASLPFTGLTPLWSATRSTTPILLSCVIGALILINAVIGDSEEEESRFPPLRWAAIALALAMLPFALIAAVSTGARIDQYGFTPERLWALVFVIVATAYAIVYIVAIVRRRRGWAGAARRSNLHLAFGLCGLALFLATPLTGFNAISTRDQVARLQSGKVRPEAFSWTALAFDYGDAGRQALKKLARSANPEISARAAKVMKAKSRWDSNMENDTQQAQAADRLRRRMRILPAPVALPPALYDVLAANQYIRGDDEDLFALIYRPGEDRAVLITSSCAQCDTDILIVRRDPNGSWRRANGYTPAIETVDDRKRRQDADRAALAKADPAGIEVRSVTRQQVFVGGRPVGDAFE